MCCITSFSGNGVVFYQHFINVVLCFMQICNLNPAIILFFFWFSSVFATLFPFPCAARGWPPCPVFLISETGQWGPIFLSPGLSRLIRVPARSFPMAEHKTGSLLLGTNPLHPGLSNGLEGAVRLAVNPLQLERSPSISSPIHTRRRSVPGSATHSVCFQTTLSLFFFFLLSTTSYFSFLLLCIVVPFADSCPANYLWVLF